MARWLLLLRLLMALPALPAAGAVDPPPSGKRPPPEGNALKEIQARIRERLKARRPRGTAADLRALAYQLFDEALDLEGSSDERYATLREAADLAAQGGDAETALDVVDALAEGFSVDPLAAKVGLLAAAERGAQTPRDCLTLAEGGLEVLEGLAAAGDLEGARKLARKLPSWSQKGQSPALTALAQAHLKEMGALERMASEARVAEKTLAERPEDSAASLAAGKSLCLVRGDWAKGLPYLVRGSDPALRALARSDLTRPASAQAQAELGDRWQALAVKERGPLIRKRLLTRALGWHEEALPRLAGIAPRRRGKQRSSACGRRSSPGR